MDYNGQVKTGKDWVIERIKGIAQEENISVELLEWEQRPVDFDEHKYSLAVVVSGERKKVERFESDSIADSVGDRQIRVELENTLRELVKSWKPAGR